ncbi:hypothetical protein Tdes44962_MAKER04649 [Teratosphaeria destructans]|uniref:Uncharacterized protein n=1 Tax=Teratosphaeria destructans TaxID=418781 RepID=A0A9W7SLN0_9PEZI|nr:hypothetical protein Tdes44962_MAKER04649 [Teratosphaeria destructans]
MAFGDGAHDESEVYKRYMQQAADHYKSAQWEEMSRALEGAKECCEHAGFPDSQRCKQRVYLQYGMLMRRYGRFHDAAAVLQKALALDEASATETFHELISLPQASRHNILQHPDQLDQGVSTERVEILGELGMVYRHLDDLTNAALAFEWQHKLSVRLIDGHNLSQEERWQAEAEVCRSIGNAGMVRYQKALLDLPSRESQRSLGRAIRELEERVLRARALRKLDQIPNNDLAASLSKKAHSWEAIGIVRFVLCYIAKGDINKALHYGAQGVAVCRDLPDPTSRAHARFYHGLALWHAGRREEAKRLFEAHGPDSRDLCTPAIAFCKEPCGEFRGYLRLLVAEVKVRLDHVDEQGYSALDYAVFAGDKESEELVLEGLAMDTEGGQLPRRPTELALLKDEAYLRKCYRIVFQEHFRPAFGDEESNAVAAAKEAYSRALHSDQQMATRIDPLKYVRYADFKQHGRLPRFDDEGIVQQYRGEANEKDVVIIFMSYRWIGWHSQPPKNGPDDEQNTQFRRMVDAIEKLREEKSISVDHLCLWLVSTAHHV